MTDHPDSRLHRAAVGEDCYLLPTTSIAAAATENGAAEDSSSFASSARRSRNLVTLVVVFALLAAAIAIFSSPKWQGEELSKSSAGINLAEVRPDVDEKDVEILRQPMQYEALVKNKDDALQAAKLTGIEVDRVDSAIVWDGGIGGKIKPKGPLNGRRIGVLVASEFSDFQAYYLASYIGENGGECEFLLVDWVTWKNVRPNIPGKGVRGMWDLSVDPMPMMGGTDKAAKYQGLRDADPHDYDALVVLGGHSADVMVTEREVIDFIQAAANKGAVMGSIGEGSMLFIAAGIVQGKKCTGNRLVDYMLRKISDVQMGPVVTDQKLITARDTIDTPAFMRALCKAIDPTYTDIWGGSLVGKKILLPAGDDYEDIELIVPTLEFLYRGADVVIGLFESQFKSRAPHGSQLTVGNFGTTIPFQEIPDEYYTTKKLDDIQMEDFDVVVISGGFNPWNLVATGRTKWLKEVYHSGKLIAAICHGPIYLSASKLVEGKKITGWLASKDSVEIMGGEFDPDAWAAVIDGQIISGRTPPEIPEFVDAISVALLED